MDILVKLKQKYEIMKFDRKEKFKVFYAIFSKKGFSKQLLELAQKDKSLILIEIKDMVFE